ncbi:MAG: hypothetical protein GX413_05075 [Acetobacter sp.]|nr:hypothetical protein [Acetobacter sp.]
MPQNSLTQNEPFTPGITRTPTERMRRKVAHIAATCAMGAWFLLAVAPVIVVLLEVR